VEWAEWAEACRASEEMRMTNREISTIFRRRSSWRAPNKRSRSKRLKAPIDVY
jgi:hypothetical protein